MTDGIMANHLLDIEEAEASSFYAEELAILASIPDGQDYYEYVLKHVQLDRSNPKNSYYMFIHEKVDQIDLTRPCLFTGRATALPDIDVDFPTDYREKAIEYVRKRYGEDKVCQISTFGRLSGRSALKAVMRAEGLIDQETMNEITAGIPDEAAISDKLEESGDYSIITWVLENPDLAFKMAPPKTTPTSNFCRIEDEVLVGDYAEIFSKAIALEGTFQLKGKHAAGVIISSDVISDVCPMCLSTDGVPIAYMDMGDLEKLGQVKFDFLGVDILNKIQEAYGLQILNVPLDDDKAWDVICSGNTKGIFQIESNLGRKWSMEVKPHNIEELAALISIIRPGTLHSHVDDGRNMTQVYADRKNGIELVPDTPINKVIGTYGILIFQESLLNICKQIAGFNSASSISMMKSVGKKDAKKLFALEEQFLSGCNKVGIITDVEAKALFTNIRHASRYLFNASHAFSYSFPAYWSAYIKAHQPLKFYEVWLKYSKNKKKEAHAEVRNLVLSARMDNIEILPPSCEYLTEGCFIKDESVVFGVSLIKGASDGEIAKLFDLMKIHGVRAPLLTYLIDILPNINKTTVEALITCGCFSYLGHSRAVLQHSYECVRDLTDKELAFIAERQFESLEAALIATAVTKKEGGGCATAARVGKVQAILERLRNPGRVLHDLPSKIAASEEALIGTTLSCSYMDSCLSAGVADTTCKEIRRGKPGKRTLVVRVKEVKEHVIKGSDKTMAFLTISDDSAELDNVVCFADQYSQFSRFLYEGAFVSVFGELGKQKSFVIERCVEL